MNEASVISNQFIKSINCEKDTVECLRSKSVEDILKSQNSLPAMSLPNIPLFRPVLDANEFPRDHLSAFQNGRFHHVPILLGPTKDEMNYFLCDKYLNMTSTEYNEYILQEFGQQRAREIHQKYPLRTYPSPKDALNNVLSDHIFKCPTKQVANLLSKYVPVHLYSFEYFSGFSSPCLGVAHVHELPYLFPSILKYYFKGYKLTIEEQNYSKTFRKLWSSFVRGNFNFERYDEKRSNYLEINQVFTVKENFRINFCS